MAKSRLLGTSAEADQPIKPGVTSTELLAWLISQLFVLLALVGVFDVYCGNVWIRVAALGGSAFSTGLYVHSRSAVKSAAALSRIQRVPAPTPEV